MFEQQPAASQVNFVGSMAQSNGGGGQLEPSPSSLAVPAIIATNQNTPQQSQYSPQATLYQQQLIKSAQQFAQQQQQQQQQPARLNGFSQPTNLIQQQQFPPDGQQNSPQQANQFTASAQESFYGTSNGRPAPIYAPKPAYYGQIAQQQAASRQSQMYQTARQVAISQQLQPAGNYVQQQQQQHSPAQISLAANRQAQASQQNQMPIMQSAIAQPAAGSPQSALEQQQRQMQQLVMSYQQQQQQEQLQIQLAQQNSYVLQQNQRANSQEAARLAPILSRQLSEQTNQLTNGNFWPTTEAIQGQLKSQPMFSSAIVQQPSLVNQRPSVNHRARAPLSDRDSVSTLSRFNQFDERRSITMRSQYTTNALGGKSAQQFGFFELAGEALRQMLGFEAARLATGSPLLGDTPNQDQLRRNLSVSASSATGGGLDQAAHKLHQPTASISPKVTVIDSGDERQFSRRVLSYRMAITRLLSFLVSCFVLLSPVVMLLLPKMEPLIRATQEQNSALEYNSQEPSLVPSNVVTHAVGLAGQRQLAKVAGGVHQLHQQQQQPQWRISECNSSDCDGPLIGFVLRLILLAVAHWAIFFRRQTATLPRLDFQRCLLISLAVLIAAAYWLFFVFRVFDKRHNDFELHYMTIVQFAISMLETLILLHYVALTLIELRNRKRVYCLKVVRSPDGESKYYSCGSLSIQKCAQFVLEKYHRDFNQFNSYKEQLLASEDELAHYLKRQRQAQNQDSELEQAAGGGGSRRGASRRQSPTARRNQTSEDEDEEGRDGDEVGADSSRQQSRRSRRSHRHHHHARKRHRRGDHEDEAADRDDDEEARKLPAKRTNQSDESSADEEDERDKRTRGKVESQDEETEQAATSSQRRKGQQKQQRAQVGEAAESADQSSDTPSKLKESSLETIRAANVAPSEGQNGERTSSTNDIEISDRPSRQHQARGRGDETESVRSARSRRSTGSRMHRSHRSESSRHHSARNQRDRSASRSGRAHTSIEVELNGDHQQQQHQARPTDLADEHERKVRRRKLRLLAAVEDSFEQVRLLDEGALKQTANQTGLRQAGGLDASQLARTLYPNIARPLQKYLRLTKQTGRHNLQSIYEHLSKCLLFRLSARTFLEKFVQFDPVWQQSETSLFANCRLFGQLNKRTDQEVQLNSWSLICDTLSARQIDSGTFFVLRQGQISLLVSVAELPHLKLSEQVVDQNSCRFAFGPNPETTSV